VKEGSDTLEYVRSLVRPEPGWVTHAIWWHVYPLGFAGADTTGADRSSAHGLRQLQAWLDFAVDLGASGLSLGPIFDSSSHGYDTIDHFRIDPRLGDAEDFSSLVAAARARGLRIILDGVFNHVGRAFPAFREPSRRPSSDRRSWFRWDARGAPVLFEGNAGLVVLDHANPAVAEYVVSVMDYWLDAGVDGWRLDAAYAVPAPFWASVLGNVRRRHPDAYFFGEVLHGDYAGYVRDSTLDSVTQYELWKAIWSSINDGNFFELDWALRRHNAFLNTFVPYTFIGNHDVTRLASRILDQRHLAHAVTLLFLLGGTPSIYYGDEQGLLGIKDHRVGGDDAIRPAFPAKPGLPRGDNDTLRLHRQLIAVRRQHPWLHRARSETVELTNATVILRVSSADHRLVVALNVGDALLDFTSSGDRPVDLIAGRAARHGTAWTVPPHGWAILC
jgi:cyclomaltodextrinase / maltogenic alpha-amylase / neopullulanase